VTGDMEPKGQAGSSRSKRERVLSNLDRLTETGRLTQAEAEHLGTASTTEEFDDAARSIRLRHVSATLKTAVEQGWMTNEEAEALRERVAAGEDSDAIRAELRRLRERGADRKPAP